MVVYHALDGDKEMMVCPVTVWEEMVEEQGQMVKRFTHASEYRPACQPQGIHHHSTPKEKIDCFLSYFVGRSDVFAIRYDNYKNNTSGYVPACYRARTPLCPRTNGKKQKCVDCPNQKFMQFDAKYVEKHLRGEMIIGVYPMLPDETCSFLAFDFDGKE